MESDLLKGVGKDTLSRVRLEKRSYGAGMTVHEQGKRCSCVDIVLSDKLVAYSLSRLGTERIMFEFKRGSVIGANLLFGSDDTYPMNIYCTSDSTLLRIKKEDVEILLNDYAFTMNFIRSISINSQGMNKRIAMYSQRSLRDNIIGYLEKLSENQESRLVVLPITKKQLADYLGVQRPSLFRELKRMKEEGLLEVRNRSIMLMKDKL